MKTLLLTLALLALPQVRSFSPAPEIEIAYVDLKIAPDGKQFIMMFEPPQARCGR